MVMEINDLKRKANWARRQVLEMTADHGSSHIGGIFSCTEILVTLYYGNVLRFDTKNPKWDERDRIIVGKGHASIAFYIIWADLGFIDSSWLRQFGTDGGSLGVQLNINTPGVEYNTGSLGNALGVAAGIGLAARMDKKRHRAFALLGDGECAEGSIWESIEFASKQKLNNLIGIIDRNRLGVLDVIDDSDENGKLDERIQSFGWKCITIDGHSFKDILSAFNDLDRLEKPLMVIANTVKGKGVSFMENEAEWHNLGLTQKQLDLARKELDKDI